MSRFWRRLRGAVGMGVSWAVAWFLAGIVLWVVVGPDAADVPFPIGFGLLGFLAGLAFSGVLTLTEGRRPGSFEEMSLPRFTLWGGLGGLLFAGIFVTVVGALGAASLDYLTMGTIFGLVGAGSAAGTLSLARWATSDDPELPDGASDPERQLPHR